MPDCFFTDQIAVLKCLFANEKDDIQPASEYLPTSISTRGLGNLGTKTIETQIESWQGKTNHNRQYTVINFLFQIPPMYVVVNVQNSYLHLTILIMILMAIFNYPNNKSFLF